MHFIDGALNHRDQVDRLRLDADGAADHPRHVQEVVDDACQGLGVALDGVDRVRRPRGIELPTAQQPRPAEDGVQGVPQLVGDDGQKLVLRPVHRDGFRS